MALARKEWEPEIWGRVAAHAAAAVSGAARDADAWPAAARAARHVLRTFSTSFFMVTRFLPREKREQVEVIYAAVRYPDEIVDTFAWEEPRKYEALDAWEAQYEAGLGAASLRSAVQSGVPVFAAAFAEVVRRHGIPQEHYRDFLRAMRRDVRPGVYATMPDLIDEYVYGSAIVIGYFLAYVYGATSPDEFPRALTFARDLGTALQLTNFVRDVGEDQGRGRLYLPLEYLRAEGITRTDAYDPAQRAAIGRVVRRVAEEADAHYQRARGNLDAFAPDTRPATQACLEVYSRLNWQIRNSREGFLHRETLPFREKFRLLPMSKYWRLPLAFLHS